MLAALAGYAVGLVGHAGLEIVARAFFARQDTRTPLLVAVLGLISTLLLSLLLRPLLGHAGLALANSLGITLEMLVLLSLGGSNDFRLGRTLVRASLATCVMGLALVGLQMWWPLSGAALLSKALFVGTGAVLGLSVYLASAWFMGLHEIRTLGPLITNVYTRCIRYKNNVCIF